MASVPLTQQHLESNLSGRLDRRTIINSYLREQNRHASAFANEGRELTLSWTCPPRTPEEQTQVRHSISQAEMYGFGTPILKPRRISQRQRDDTGVTSAIGLSAPRRKDPASDPKIATLTDRMEKRSSHKPARRKQSPVPDSKKSSGKRAVRDEDSDPDKEARELILKLHALLYFSVLYHAQAWRNAVNGNARNVPSHKGQGRQLAKTNAPMSTTR
jgi:hypothetical protein